MEIFYIGFVVLSVLILAEASTITVDEYHCGGDNTLNNNERLFLNYYGANLNQENSDTYDDFSSKECVFKISAVQENSEICIRSRRKLPLSFLVKCNIIFKYYRGSYDYLEKSYSCIDFDISPLCTTNEDTVHAVFIYNELFSYMYKGLSIEVEIYARKPVQQVNYQNDWSSWSSSSDNDTSDDSDEETPIGLIFFISLIVFTLLFICWIYCCQTSKPTNTGGATVTETLPDNLYRNEHNEHIEENRPAIEDNLPEDPWKPPDYKTVTAIDQSFYGETGPRRYVSKETGQSCKEDTDDPPPPYPGV